MAVLQTYDNITFDEIPRPRNYRNMLLGAVDMEIVSPDKGWGCAWHEHYPICTSSQAEGRWVVKDPRLLGEFRHCNTGHTHGNCSNPDGHRLNCKKVCHPRNNLAALLLQTGISRGY